MDVRRFSEWASSIDGLVKIIVVLIGAPGLLFTALSSQLAQVGGFIGLPRQAAAAIAVLLILPLIYLVWRSYRKFATASRVKEPAHFTLAPTTPEGLIGRDDDVRMLLQAVMRNRLVLLDGESGCGKSALVAAGLVPRLRATDGLLPILVRDWGDDWERGPLAAALDALYDTMTKEQREKLGWNNPPDLAADRDTLRAELEQRLDDLSNVLRRRPLLIVDQFDDYQARDRDRFLDDGGNWLPPSELAARNRFWSAVKSRLERGQMHLLAVTRSDTASGLSCIRFLEKGMTADRPLPRVEFDYLRPLLAGIAPEDANPPVVSNPERGWQELREKLEADLRVQGAILMQQVRTTLLGLRQLRLLTPAEYRRAGELRGLEMLVIARSLRRAGDRLGGEAALQAVRALMNALVLPGGPNQPPKAQRRLLSELVPLVGDRERTGLALRSLQEDEIVRPAEGRGHEPAWQLDHDYLARAVIAEARQADRWALSLQEGLARYRDAAGSWRQIWASLLPVGTQARILWERSQGRLRYGEAAPYARLSGLKPALLVVGLLLAGWGGYTWNQDRLLTAEARKIYERFGGREEGRAVLEAWRADRPVRTRLFEQVQQHSDLLGRALNSQWPVAHAGLENETGLQVAGVLRIRIDLTTDPFEAAHLATAYAAVAQKLASQDDIEAAATALRIRLERATEYSARRPLATAYAAVARRLARQDDIKAEATALRIRLERATESIERQDLATAYAAVAQQLARQDDIKAEATALRTRIELAIGSAERRALATAYAAIAGRLASQDDIKAAATALRLCLELETDPFEAAHLATAYAAIAQKLASQDDIKADAVALRTRLERATEYSARRPLATAYATVARRLARQDDIKAEATALRIRLERATESIERQDLATAYAAVAQQLARQDDIKAEATALRIRLELATNSFEVRSLAAAYAAVAQKLASQDDIKAAAGALRFRLELATTSFGEEALATAYAAVAQKLASQDDIKAAATALRIRLERATNTWERLAPAIGSVVQPLDSQDDIKVEGTAIPILVTPTRVSLEDLATAYAAVAQQLARQDDIKAEATALRIRLELAIGSAERRALATAYAAIAGRLASQDDIKAAATALRFRLELETDPFEAAHLATAYAAIAQKLASQDDIKADAVALRTRLERATGSFEAQAFATAYAAITRRMLEVLVSERRDVAATVEEILVMAGHPYVRDAEPLLTALGPVAQRPLRDAASAVAWWVERFQGDPARLRPRASTSR